MSDLRFLLWNMERINDLFVSGDEDDPPAFWPDDEPAHHRGATVRERRGYWGVALGNQGIPRYYCPPATSSSPLRQAS